VYRDLSNLIDLKTYRDLSNLIDLKTIFKNSPNINFYSFYFSVRYTKLIVEILLKQ